MRGNGLNNNRILCFDNVRAFCIIWIIAFWHLSNYNELNFNTPLGNNVTIGCLAVMFFISGYCLGGKTLNDKHDVVRFYQRRFFRIYPLYMCALIALFCMHIFLGLDYVSSTRQFVYSLFGMACIFPPAPSTLWFINCLLLYYLVTPFWTLCKNKSRVIKILLIVLVFFISRLMIFMKSVDPRLGFYAVFYFVGLYWSDKEISSKLTDFWKCISLTFVIFAVLLLTHLGNIYEIDMSLSIIGYFIGAF